MRPRSTPRRRRAPGFLDELTAEGWGLPVIAFLLSLVVSAIGAVGLIWHVPEGEAWRYAVAALVFLAQWGANVSLLRARKLSRADRRRYLMAYVICAFVAALGLFHAGLEIRAPEHARVIVADAAQRQPLREALAAERAALAAAAAEIAAVSAKARAENWPGERTERQQRANLTVYAAAERRQLAAQTAIEALPAAPAPNRPLDWIDAVVALAALALALVERAFYWGMLAPREEAALKPAKRQPIAEPPSPQEALQGVLIDLARHRVARAFKAAALTTAFAAPLGGLAAAEAPPLAVQDEVKAGQAGGCGRPLAASPEINEFDRAASFLLAGRSRREVMGATGLKRWRVDAIAHSLGLSDTLARQ